MSLPRRIQKQFPPRDGLRIQRSPGAPEEANRFICRRRGRIENVKQIVKDITREAVNFYWRIGRVPKRHGEFVRWSAEIRKLKRIGRRRRVFGLNFTIRGSVIQSFGIFGGVLRAHLTVIDVGHVSCIWTENVSKRRVFDVGTFPNELKSSFIKPPAYRDHL